MRAVKASGSIYTTKTRLFKYIENFITKTWKFSDKNSDIFHISAQNIHYENTPIQIYSNFNLQKLKIFRYKNSDIFHISAQNINCWYSLKPPRRGGSNEYSQSMF